MIVGKNRRVEGILLVALLAGACGSSDTTGTGQECTIVPDGGGSDQAPVDNTWACLDRGAVSNPAAGTIHRTIAFVNLLSQGPLAGLTVALCNKLDADCTLPVLQLQSNSAGQIDVEMPVGFDGYFQAEGAGIYPTLIFLPSSSEPTTSISIPLLPASFFPTMIRGAGATAVAEDRSTVMVTALDCLGRPAAGLSLSSPQADAQTISYMTAGGMPSRVASVTDDSGAGGLVNVPAGGLLINATLAASNRPVESIGVQARPGYVSMAILMPNGS